MNKVHRELHAYARRVKLRQIVHARRTYGVYVDGGKIYEGADLAALVKHTLNDGIRIKANAFRPSEHLHVGNTCLSLRRYAARTGKPMSEASASLLTQTRDNPNYANTLRRIMRRHFPERWRTLDESISLGRQELIEIHASRAARQWELKRPFRTESGMFFPRGYPVHGGIRFMVSAPGNSLDVVAYVPADMVKESAHA